MTHHSWQHGYAIAATTSPERWGPTAMAVVVFAIAASCASLVVWQLDRQDIEAERARASDMTGDHANALQAQMEHSLSATSALAVCAASNALPTKR